MDAITYLIYIVLWEAMWFLGIGYVVFFRRASGWWFVLAVLMSGSAYSPGTWSFP